MDGSHPILKSDYQNHNFASVYTTDVTSKHGFVLWFKRKVRWPKRSQPTP